MVNIIEIEILHQVASGFGSTPACRLAQKTFCNYVAAANETEMEVIKSINMQYQVKTNFFLLLYKNYETVLLFSKGNSWYRVELINN